MMKKILLLTLCCMLFIGCSSNNETTKENQEEKNDSNIIESVINTVTNKKVEIILPVYDFGEHENIQSYVDYQNEKGENNFKVYDDSHYIVEITEEERLDSLEKLYGQTGKEKFLSTIDETYTNVFTELKFEDDGKIIVLYANNDNYKNSFGAGFGAMLMSKLWSDMCQAYNMIPLEERSFYFQILNNETNELIYEYPET